jgi:hypothetical protein
MANPRVFVDQPPRRTPRAGGIKNVADVQSFERAFAAEGIDWQSPGCSFPEPAPGLCWGNVVVAEKAYNGISNLESGPVFALYAGVECFLETEAASEYSARATALLDAGEDRAIEAMLRTYVETLLLGRSNATSWAEAIGMLEYMADIGYLGRPVILMNRSDAIVAKGLGLLEGDKDGNIWTINGTPVLSSGSFTQNQPTVIGDLTLYRSDSVATPAEDPITNMAMAIAERAYALAIDCGYAFGMQVTLPTP